MRLTQCFISNEDFLLHLGCLVARRCTSGQRQIIIVTVLQISTYEVLSLRGPLISPLSG